MRDTLQVRTLVSELGRVEVSEQGISDVFPAPGYPGQGQLSKVWRWQNCNWQVFGDENRCRGIPSHPRFSMWIFRLNQQLSRSRGCPGMKVVVEDEEVGRKAAK